MKMSSAEKSRHMLSPRKRSPRKQIRMPTRAASSNAIGKKNSHSQRKKTCEQKTLQHFFSKQQQKSKATELIRDSGSQEVPLIIDDSDSELDTATGDNGNNTQNHVVRNLFSPSPVKESSGKRCSPEASQLPNASAEATSRTDGSKGFKGSDGSDGSKVASQRRVVTSPHSEPNSEPSSDFDRDDSEIRMADLAEVTFTESKSNHHQHHHHHQSWTPQADTFETLLEKARKLQLLNEYDTELLRRFEKLSRQAREICLRLYQRKHQWISRAKISYQLDDVDACLTEAVGGEFLHDKSKLDDLGKLLGLLPIKDVVALGRKFCDLRSSVSKSDTIDALVAHSNRKDVLFGQQRIRDNIVKSSRQLLDQCFLVAPEFADAVTRVLTLNSLGSHFDTFVTAADRNDHGCCNLYTIGQYLRGGFVFAAEHDTDDVIGHIFRCCDDFTLYCEARVRHFQLLRLIESKRYDNDDAVTSVFDRNFAWFVANYSPAQFSKDANLPRFLHRFTFSYGLLKFLSIGAEIFERQKRYDEAVDLYFVILSQAAFLHNRRGVYWNRLLLDVDAHLKKPQNALALAHVALRDAIFDQHKYDIQLRAERLSKRLRITTNLAPFAMPTDAPVETISGQLVQKAIIGRNNVFASVDSYGERVVGPEAVAIEHYLNVGFTQGVHGETPTMLMLFSLICWNIIFGTVTESEPKTPTLNTVRLTKAIETEVIRNVFAGPNDAHRAATSLKRKRTAPKQKPDQKPDQKQKKPPEMMLTTRPLEHRSRYSIEFPSESQSVIGTAGALQTFVYVSEFQSGPLDIGYPEFYLNRKRAIDQHLNELSRTSSDEIVRRASAAYEKHNGKVNPFFNWEVLTKDEVESLLRCIPVDVLVGVSRQLLTDFRLYRSGFPDVIMWNECTRKWKVIEVKGPGDTLSTKQRYWMHLLRSLGVDCVTCRVESVHKRKIRPISSDPNVV